MEPEKIPSSEKSDDPLSFRSVVFGFMLVMDWLALTDGLLNVLPDLGWFSVLGWLACAPLAFFILWIPYFGALLAIGSMTTAWGWPWWITTIMLIVHIGYWTHEYNLHQKDENGSKA